MIVGTRGARHGVCFIDGTFECITSADAIGRISLAVVVAGDIIIVAIIEAIGVAVVGWQF